MKLRRRHGSRSTVENPSPILKYDSLLSRQSEARYHSSCRKDRRYRADEIPSYEGIWSDREAWAAIASTGVYCWFRSGALSQTALLPGFLRVHRTARGQITANIPSHEDILLLCIQTNIHGMFGPARTRSAILLTFNTDNSGDGKRRWEVLPPDEYGSSTAAATWRRDCPGPASDRSRKVSR